jgi:hypothetical protein
VGGVIGGIALICLTCFGIFFLRRKRIREKPLPPLPRSARRRLFDVKGWSISDHTYSPKRYWENSYGPVEINNPSEEKPLPVELSSANYDRRSTRSIGLPV